MKFVFFFFILFFPSFWIWGENVSARTKSKKFFGPLMVTAMASTFFILLVGYLWLLYSVLGMKLGIALNF